MDYKDRDGQGNNVHKQLLYRGDYVTVGQMDRVFLLSLSICGGGK